LLTREAQRVARLCMNEGQQRASPRLSVNDCVRLLMASDEQRKLPCIQSLLEGERNFLPFAHRRCLRCPAQVERQAPSANPFGEQDELLQVRELIGKTCGHTCHRSSCFLSSCVMRERHALV